MLGPWATPDSRDAWASHIPPSNRVGPRGKVTVTRTERADVNAKVTAEIESAVSNAYDNA
jgi:hypothetical protein